MKLSWERFSLAIFMLLLSPLATAQSGSPSNQPCELGYTVGFFNGVWNTPYDAIQGRDAVKAAVREATASSNNVYNKEDVKYELFYNHTGGASGSSTALGNKLEDVAEVFVQRANELDASGALATDSFYMFWDVVNGTTTFHLPLSTASSDFDQLVSKFVNDAIAAAAGGISALLSSPPTAADYAQQQAQLTTEANAGRKLLLVAHSQGNLFVNVAYDFIQPVVTSARVDVVHIAPASPTLRGPYVLSSGDLVINALRLVGGSSSVPANNITIPLSLADPSGHTLEGTYLDADPTRNAGRSSVEANLTSALSLLSSPVSCNATISPSTSSVSAGGSASLMATVAPPVADPALTILYQWTVTGSAGGVITGSGTGAGVATYISSSPVITYTSSGSATPGAADTVTVAVMTATDPSDLTTAKQIGSGTAMIGIAQATSTYTYTGSPYDPNFCTVNAYTECAMGNTTGTITFSIPSGFTGSTTGVNLGSGVSGQCGSGGTAGIVSASFTAHGVTQTLDLVNDPLVSLYCYAPFVFEKGTLTHWKFSIVRNLYPGTSSPAYEEAIALGDVQQNGFTCYGSLLCADEAFNGLAYPMQISGDTGTNGFWSPPH
jgi:hypothetical protein